MNLTEELLTAEEKDVLKEVLNIAFGLSSSLIGDMLDSHAVLVIPEIEVVNIEDLEDVVSSKLHEDKIYFIAKQLFKSDFSGESVFIMNHLEAEKLTKMTMKNEDVTENDIENTFNELSNIISTACLGQIGEMIHKSIYFEPPMVEKKSKINIIERNKKFEYDKVILMESLLNLDEEGISGYMFIMTNLDSFSNLKKSLLGDIG